MSQELEEKVALACFEVDLEWFAARIPDVPIEELRQHAKADLATNYAAIARAALAVVREAMAEPNEDMVLKGYNALIEWDARTGEDLGMMEIWDAMLSASPLGEQ